MKFPFASHSAGRSILFNHRFVSRASLTVVMLLAIAGLLIYVDHSRAAGGDIDPAFNAGGSGADQPVYALTVQPDGKIVIAGIFTSYNGDATVSARVMRLNADGTRDATFNAGGAGATDFGSVYAVAVQPDGKIVIGGTFTSYNGDAAASDGVMRLNADGTRDTTFNAGGAGINGFASAVAVQPDGKIVIGGQFTSYNGDAAASDCVMRLNANGTRDTTFNAGGAGANNNVQAVTVQPDGKIVIGGDFTIYNGGGAKRVSRLNGNGTLDTNFNALGSGANDSVSAVALQPDGKIVIGGRFSIYNGNAAGCVTRLNADGTLDTTFNVGGAGANFPVRAVALQPDGKIVIGGDFTSYNDDAAASDQVMRLNTDGTRNMNFNAGGAGPDGSVYAVALQPDGKVMIGGFFTSYNGDAAAPDYVIRLLPAPGSLAFSSATYSAYETDGNATITLKRTGGTDIQVVAKVTLTDVTTSPADYRFAPGAGDTTFNAGGAGASNSLFAVAVQPDGKIVIGGAFISYNGDGDAATSDYVMRLNADGTRDTTFNAGGAGANDLVLAVALQPDGKIVIAGFFTSYNGDAAANDYVMRLNADGTRDPTFNTLGAGADGPALAVAVQPDGKIVIGGSFTSYNSDTAASDRVMRLNADGTRDMTFNAGGAGPDNLVIAVAVQPDGKIVIGGNFTSYNSDGSASDRVMRLNADGTRDMTFNPGGAGANHEVRTLAVQPDGKIVIGGDFTIYNDGGPKRVTRLNSDGTRDTTFNAGGTGADDSRALAVAMQPDGKIVIGGSFSSYNGDTAGHVIRLNADGTRDTSFNTGGTGVDSSVFVDGSVLAVAVQPDGKIVIGGNFTSYNGNAAASDYVMRLNGDLFVTWPAGDATDKVILLPIVNDGVPEGDETLKMNLALMSGGATLGSPFSSSLTIYDPKTTPAVTFDAAPTPTYLGGNFTVSASTTNTDSGTLTYSRVGGPCALVSGATFSSSGAGTCVVKATGADTTHFNVASNTQSVIIAKATPAVTFGAAPTPTYLGGNFTVSASTTNTDSASLTYSRVSGPCAFASGATFSSSGAGTCVVQADGAATTNFNAASSTQNVIIAKATPTVTFGPAPTPTYLGGNFTVSASTTNTDSASLTYSRVSGPCAFVNGSTFSSSGAGTCVVQADGAATTNFNAASNTKSVIIAKATPTVTFGSAPTPTFGGGNFTVAASTTNTESSTLTYSRMSGPCAFVNGATFSSSGAGTCVVQADGAATTNFNAASMTQTVTIGKSNQTITFGALANKTFGDPDFPVSANTSSTLAVSFNAAGPCAVSGSTVHLTGVGSCTITASQTGDANYQPAPDVPQTFNINPQGGFISFSATNYSVNESAGFVTVTINRTENTTAQVTVDYGTDDTGAPVNCGAVNSGLAASRCDFTAMFGTLNFAANETQKTLAIPINQDSFAEGPEVFTINLSNATGGSALATPSAPTITISDSPPPAVNASDNTAAFVRQQYHDFLNRDPDAPGLAFWIDNIDKCNDPARRPAGQTVAQCIEIERINTSAAFFLSIEFLQSGGFVRDFYVAALDRPLTNNMPGFVEFERDTQAVQRGVTVGQGSWQATLDANRSAFMNQFVVRSEFVGLYPNTDTPTQYVDKLVAHAAVVLTPAERSAAINEFGAANTASDPAARGRALLRVTQSTAFQQREFNRAFVHIQYLGYLRRNPNAAPDTNFDGYSFWVTKLNAFGGNYITSEMVKAFLSSSEYRQRFGP